MIKIKNKSIVFTTLFLICFIFCIFIILNKTKFISRLGNKEQFTFNGYGLKVEKENYIIKDDYTINLNKKGEFDFDVIFINNSGKKSSFSLMLYLNYDKVPFRANDKIKIPISINDNNLVFKNNSLVVSIVAGVDKHACDLKEVNNFFGTNVEYNLKVNENTKEIKDKINNLDDKLEHININNNYTGIFVNQDFNNINDFYLPDNKIYAKPGQDVNLAMRFGGYTGVDNYLIWLNIGYEQYLINNLNKYILIKNPESCLQYKKITFKAPIEKGKYELWAFLAKNPLNFQNNSQKLRHGLDYSHRITLIVE